MHEQKKKKKKNKKKKEEEEAPKKGSDAALGRVGGDVCSLLVQ